MFPLPYRELSKSFGAVLYIPALLINSYKLFRYVNKYKIAIVHVNDMYNLCGIVLKIFKPKLRLVYHVRLLPESYIRNIYSFYIFLIRKFADEVIAVSETVQRILQNRYNCSSHLIYGFMEMSADISRQSEVQLKSDPITLLYLANYTPGKGHEYAIEAVVKANRKIKNLKMIMAGGVFGSAKNLNFRKHLEKMVQHYDAGDYIFFFDFVEDVRQLMKSCHIFLNFSESESFSRTCLEALTWGMPVIATDCGGPAEMIINGQTGILVPVGDTDAMSKAIIKLAVNEQLRMKLSKEGQQYVKEKFKPENAIRAMRNIYLKMLNPLP